MIRPYAGRAKPSRQLDAITVEQMCETAEKTHELDDEKLSSDFVN